MGELAAKMSAAIDALYALIGKIEKSLSLGGRSHVSSQAGSLAPMNSTQSWVQSLPDSAAIISVNNSPAEPTSPIDQP